MELTVSQRSQGTNKEILTYCQSFYEDVYKSHINGQVLDNLFCNYVEDINVKTLSEDEKENWEGIPTQAKLLQALKAQNQINHQV